LVQSQTWLKESSPEEGKTNFISKLSVRTRKFNQKTVVEPEGKDRDAGLRIIFVARGDKKPAIWGLLIT